MEPNEIIIAVGLFIILLYYIYIFTILPAIKKPKELDRFKKTKYAHRGYHCLDEGIPENTMAAFKRAVDMGFGIEFDVNLSKDKKPVIMHDDSLKRMCGVDIKISQSNYGDIANYSIASTEQTPPLLSDILELVDGKVTLLVELKTVGGNYAELCTVAFELLDNYKGDYMVESFDPRVLTWMKKHRKNVVRGQLACYMSTKSSHGKKSFLLRNLMLNFLSRPHFVAYKFADRANVSLVVCRGLGKAPVFYWTIRDEDTANRALADGGTIIFENFDPSDL